MQWAFNASSSPQNESAAFQVDMLKRRQFLKFSASPNTKPDGYWLHLNRPAMACRFEATLPSSDRAGTNVARSALAEVDRHEQQLTIFRDSSEVSYINRTAASHPVPVEPSLFALLLLSQQLCLDTEGAFDITSGPLSDCWGFLRRQGRVPAPAEIDSARALAGADRLQLDRESRTIRFDRPGVRINFGAIGKGYALDRVAAKMVTRVHSALLSAGSSSVRAIGSGDRRQTGWIVGVRHPRQKNRRLAILRMRNCSMATSGGEEQFFEHNGKSYGHIIDPRSGMPAETVNSVTVVADSAAVADGLATAFYVGGRELAERYCSTHPGVLSLMLESGAAHPVVFGSNDRCEVEVITE